MSEEDLPGEIEETPSPDANVESSTTPEADEKAKGQPEAGATETPVKKVNKVQERINQLTRKNYDQKHENEDLKARLLKLEQEPPKIAEAPVTRVAPNEDDFELSSDYHTANAKYYADVSGDAAEKRIVASDSANTEKAAQTARQTEIEGKKAVFEKKLEAIRGNFEDFEEVAYGNNKQFMDMDLAEQIFELDKGPEVAYYLGSHLDVSERIFALPPVKRARELTKLEFQVKALKPKLVSGAPDPITTLGNSETVAETDPDKMTADEWQAWRNKQIYG